MKKLIDWMRNDPIGRRFIFGMAVVNLIALVICAFRLGLFLGRGY